MRAVELRAIQRQHRIMQRAVRRGEVPLAELEEYERKNAAALGLAIPPDDPNATPFKTRDGKPLHLRDVFHGAPLFIVLSGPSLVSLDLSLLQRRGVATFGVNNSPAMFRPNFWTFVDKPMKFHDAIWRDPYTLKFIPLRHARKPLRKKTCHGFEMMHCQRPDGCQEIVQCGNMPGVVGYERNADFNAARWLHEATVNWGNSLASHRRNRNHRCLNTMFAVLKIAYWLGFRVIYLLGCDFRMSSERPYAFDQGGDEAKAASNNNGYAVMLSMFHELKPHFDSAGFHVFNCTPNSGLTVFPHVPYLEAVASATKHVPQDPLDTAGWYDC